MVPVRAWHRRRHQRAVSELIETLRGPAFEKNEAVRRCIEEAEVDGVKLPVMSLMHELLQTHVDFTCRKLAENAGIERD
jgi:hypothetical protein